MQQKEKYYFIGMKPVRNINMAEPYFSKEDRQLIHAEIDNILDGALSMGPNVQEFEKEFAALVGVKYAIAMNSCTAALEVALTSYNLGAGDEVIVPVETFIATGMAIYHSGATPVFSEISEKTFCLDLEDVKHRVTPQTRGIILVHMGGHITPDILDIRKYCDHNNLFLIEDAAHAPGVKFNGKAVGSFGHVGCFSFYPTKVMTAGEGGMLTTNDDHVANYARSLQHRGRDMGSTLEQYVLPGRNIRMTEMAALLGRVQLSHLDEYLRIRQQLARIYQTQLDSDDRLRLILPDDLRASSYWKIPLLLRSEKARFFVTENMKNKYSISVDWAYQPALHLQPIFKELYATKVGDLPRSESMLSRHICLPCHPRMTESEVTYVACSLKESLDQFDAE